MTLSEQIKQELSTQATPAEISQKLSCSKPYISLVKNGRENRKKERFSVQDKIQIAFLWGADTGVDSIAADRNATKTRVIKFLKEEGLL